MTFAVFSRMIMKMIINNYNYYNDKDDKIVSHEINISLKFVLHIKIIQVINFKV